MLLLGAALPLTEGKAPSEFRLFRAGSNDSDYGPITFDDKAAADVMAAQQKKGNPLFFDWNHGMMVPKEQRTREQGASAGRFELAVRDGELWAVNCQWNEKGAAAVAAREYELFSPAFAVDEEDGVQRPTQVLNCALVNLAGLDHLEPIAAGAALEPGDVMTEAEIQKLRADLEAASAKVVTLEAKNAGRGILALSAVLGLGADVTDEARVAAVSELVKVRKDVLALAGATVVTDAIVTLTAWKDSHGKVAALTEKETARETLALQAEFDGIVAGAVKDLKVGGGTVTDEFKANELARMGGKLTAAGVEGTKKLVAMMHAKGNPVGAGPVAPKTGEQTVITAEQKALLALHGHKVETAERALAVEAAYLEAKAAREGRSSA